MQKNEESSGSIIRQLGDQRNPQHELNQISAQIEARDNLNKQIFQRYNSENLTKNKIKINNSQQFLDISKWNSELQQQIRAKKQKKDVKNINVKDERVVRYKFRQFQGNKLEQKYQKFLSMAQLSHRYTFVHDHGSYNQFCGKQDSANSRKQTKYIKSPKHIQLKLKMPIDYLQERRKKNANFFKQSKYEKIKFPQIEGNLQQNTQNNQTKKKNDILSDSQCIKNVIKLMSKSKKKQYLSPSSHCHEQNDSKRRQNQIQQLSSEKVCQAKIYQTKIGVGKKIYWKNKIVNDGCSYNEQKLRNKNHQVHQLEREVNFYIGSQIYRQQKDQNSNKNRRNEQFCQLSKNLDKYFGRKQRSKAQMKRLSKSLQQCLILKKNPQK